MASLWGRKWQSSPRPITHLGVGIVTSFHVFEHWRIFNTACILHSLPALASHRPWKLPKIYETGNAQACVAPGLSIVELHLSSSSANRIADTWGRAIQRSRPPSHEIRKYGWMPRTER